MDDLLSEFVAETREMLADMQSELLAWETDPTDGRRLDTIFRFVHTVKGNCGFFHFPRLERLSHAAESALADVRADKRPADSALVTAILAIIDRIAALTDGIVHCDIDAQDEHGDDPALEMDDDPLIAALNVMEDASGVDGEARVDRSNAPAPSAAPASKALTTENTVAGTEDALASTTTAPPRSIRLPVDLLDRVMASVSDMVLARNDLAHRLREADGASSLDGPFERLTAILADLRGDVTRMRMQRVSYLYAPLPRLVRDMAADLDKNIRFESDAGTVELDREMIEMIRDPLTHLIRNAADHGIEAPHARTAAGKPDHGCIRLTAHQSGNMIEMVLSDDGRGLDVDRIGAQAVAAGLLVAADLPTLPEEALRNLIFEPGLSTADAISAVSGRGVGMDVVKANIEKIGGSVFVSSVFGQGTQFTLRLPLTLSIVSALTVSLSGDLFAIPHEHVEEIVLARSSAVTIDRIGDREFLNYRDNRIACVGLGRTLGLKAGAQAGAQAADRRFVILRTGGAGTLFALAVDRIHDQEDLVVKPLSPPIMLAGIYAGTTLMDDGRPVPMLDVAAIAQQANVAAERPTWAARTHEDGAQDERSDKRQLMLFTELDRQRRAIDLDLVARVDQVALDAIQRTSGRAHCLIDGNLLPVATAMPDEICGPKISVLRLSDGSREIAYPVAEVHETAPCSDTFTPLPDDPILRGILLIDGAPVEVIDGFALFASVPAGAQEKTSRNCHLPPGDAWAHAMLAPLVEAAGYRIADPSEAAMADIRFTLSGEDDEPLGDGRHITLHDDPRLREHGGDAIYRYDRAAIMNALAHAGRGRT
ncbi:MAG: chemotaxis protein CheW [Pontixanthobacter sp.]